MMKRFCCLFLTMLATTALVAGEADEPDAGDNVDRAIEDLLDDTAENADTPVSTVDALLEAGEYDVAISVASDELAREPGDASLLCARARALAARGRVDEQRRDLEAAMKADPDDIEARVKLGILADELGRDEERDKLLEPIEDMLFEEKLTEPRELLLAGMALECMGFPHEAMEFYGRAQKAEGVAVEAFNAAGNLFFSKEQIGDAWREYRAAVKLNPKSPEALLGCAKCLAYNNRYAEAEKECRSALKTNPSLIGAHELLASIEMVEERYAEAEEKLKAALKINPRSMETRSLLAAVYFLRDEPELFEQECEAVLKVNPGYSEVYETVAEACRIKRRLEDAVHLFRRAEKVNPDSATALAGLGLIKFHEGEYEPAMEMLERAFRMNRFNVRVYNTLELGDRMKKFKSVSTEHFRVLLDAENDPLLADYITAELPRIRKAVEGLYGYDPPEAVHIEVFPTHRLLGARVAGLPHLGAPGVCLGKVIAMDSPKTLPGELNWRVILEHEYTHVVTLLSSKRRCSHWFTEGCAVSQEGIPRLHEWNQLLVRAARLGRFIPLNRLTTGFVRPNSPFQRTMAYCQSEIVVDFLREKHGQEALIRMLKLAGEGVDEASAIREVTGQTLEEFQAACFERMESIAAGITTRPVFFSRDEQIIRRRIEKRPQDAEALCNLALMQLAVGKHEDAARTARNVLERDGGDVWARIVLATVEHHKGDHDAALKRLKGVIEDSPGNAEAWRLVGELRREAEDDAGSAAALERSIEAYAFDPGVYKQLAATYAKMAEPGKRKKVLELWAENIPLKAEPVRMMLSACQTAGDQAGVIRAAQHLIGITPYDPVPHELLGRALASLGRNTEAVKEFEAALKADAALPPEKDGIDTEAVREMLSKLREDGEQR